MHIVLKRYSHNLVYEEYLTKTTFRAKSNGVWAKQYIKIGTPYLFLQRLKLATSNVVCNLGLGSTLE